MNSSRASGRYPKEQNKVLQSVFRSSRNFYHSDLMLRHYLQKHVSAQGLAYMHDKLEYTGAEAAGRMNELSLQADKNGPVLVKRNFFGEDIDEIRFHPAYHSLMEIAVKSEMFRVQWEPTLRSRFGNESHRLGFSAGYLYAMSECGQYCPLCMTDGVARLIDLFCSEEDKSRLMPHIYTDQVQQFYTGAMYLTEKTGGSDVGATITVAVQDQEERYLLNGEKWFCSNGNADLIFALARTASDIKGTRGLSIFLIEKQLADGGRNPIEFVRLKDKLGVRSMASAECHLRDTVAKMVGREFEGFKVMIEMVNLSRLYNSVAALATSRRALIEAWQYLNARSTFGRKAASHALVRTKLTELGALHVADFYLVWRAIKALDHADNGNEAEAQLFRLINPMAKKWSAETGVYITRESMELMGGIGYIEDGVMPKLMRDVMVLPIWEGSGNIIVLDLLRAMQKSEGFERIMAEIHNSAAVGGPYAGFLKREAGTISGFAEEMRLLPQEELEATARVFFGRLTSLYQISLLCDALDDTSRAWIEPALQFLVARYQNEGLAVVRPLSEEALSGLMAWAF